MRDLPEEDQKNILARFAMGEQCDSLRVVDSLFIVDLVADKAALQRDNSIAVQEIELLQLKAIRQRKWVWVAGAAGVIGGFLIKSSIK